MYYPDGNTTIADLHEQRAEDREARRVACEEQVRREIEATTRSSQMWQRMIDDHDIQDGAYYGLAAALAALSRGSNDGALEYLREVRAALLDLEVSIDVADREGIDW